MGCAPSAEIFRYAPFRPPQGRVRQVALIPIVEQFFPSPDCVLFQQLYDVYTDPSVRYYVRPNFDGSNGDLSRIPDAVNSREELHRALLQLARQGMFATNADVRAAYARGNAHSIRPILSAVVFLYEGASYVLEGSVPFHRHGCRTPMFVKVIGVVGDTTMMLQKGGGLVDAGKPQDALQMQTLVTKSAGDHNMTHVMLLASYVYHHQCCAVIGLPRVPPMAVRLTCFKTNIPFLCFLREMRDRMAGIVRSAHEPRWYVDEYCLHGTAAQEYVDVAIPAFAHYFISFLEAKSEQRMLKQLAHQQRVSAARNGAAQKRGSTSLVTFPIGSRQAQGESNYNESEQHGEAVKELDGIDQMQISRAAASAAKADAAASASTNATPRVTYIVKGYLTRPVTSLSAYSCAENEIYVTCMDGSVTVVDRRSVDAPDGPTHMPSLGQEDGTEEIAEERGVPTSARTVVATFTVRRGDLLSFSTLSSSPAAGEAVTDTARAECVADDDGYDSASMTSSHASLLRLRTDDDSVASSPSVLSLVRGQRETLVLRKGSWRVDDGVCIEGVLLSLVRDECKRAREASVDDPRWVHDDARNCPVHEGSFYVWRFRRGQENFFYGTVPKFVNAKPAQKRGGVLSGTRALHSSGALIRSDDMRMAQRSGNQRNANSNADVIKKPDKGVDDNGINIAPNRRRTSSTTAFQRQFIDVPIPSLAKGLLADPSDMQQQQQQQQRQLYLSHTASRASASANVCLQGSNAILGGGQTHLFPNDNTATTTASAAQLVYGVPYASPGQPSLYSMPPQAQQAMPLPACMAMQLPPPPPPRGGVWTPMAGPGAGGALSTVSMCVPDKTPPSAAVAYTVNPQGLLVPLSSVPMDANHPNVAHAASSMPPVLTAPPVPNYAMVDGRLCVLQLSPAATPPSPPHCMAHQHQHQHQQCMGSIFYILR
ncbi:hypothetical protein ABL78_3527 [Leptomonas seymouri]|uniref:Uncharacterized protein n=1 Tax=Leptomonas seymouri TaxID=5684 RepID=A0A0N1PBS8_LEPSE|nr:hypothetical protein ABL78_3527 [Leptomonas seymouri]|eukprot:KPI87393.1 hypothetical protein ABL78_3527 [Leptomonas seymouri]